MSPTVVLVAQLAVVLVGVVALALWLRRRYGRPWRTWWWGALAFVASQVVRLPLLALLGVVGAGWFADAPDAAFAVNVAVLSLSAGVFEEGARWVVLRFAARDARRWADGVVFGAGHGGIEAVLVIGGSVAGSLALLAGGDAMLDVTTDPTAAEALEAQLAAVRDITPGLAALGVWERVLAVTFHVAASLLVLRAVRERAWLWLAIAVAFHAAFNAVAAGVANAYGALAAEAALTAFTALSVLVIVRERRRDAALGPLDDASSGVASSGDAAR